MGESPAKSPEPAPAKSRRGAKKVSPVKKSSPVKKGNKKVDDAEIAVKSPKKTPKKTPWKGRAAAKKATQNISKDVEELSNLGKKKRRPSMEKDASDEVLQNDTKLVSPVKRGKRKATEIVEEASPPKRT